jgi:hypothetical protein
LNKKSIANHETKLFEAELEKFRSHQNRILQTNHKQNALLKELTKAYADLLQDKRVRSEQSKYESFNRQRNAVLTRYRKIFQAFNDLVAGLARAEAFYTEMKDTVNDLAQNVETFVNNRRDEGGQLLQQIERAKQASASSQADRERDRLREMMERMSVNESSPSTTNAAAAAAATAAASPSSSSKPSASQPPPITQAQPTTSRQQPNAANQYLYGIPPVTLPYAAQPTAAAYPSNSPLPGYPPTFPNGTQQQPFYDPMQYPYQARPPSHPGASPYQPPVQHAFPGYAQQLPQGYIPPPPPPGPPPPGGTVYGYAPVQSPTQQRQPGPSQPGGQPGQQDPWAGLGAWR